MASPGSDVVAVLGFAGLGLFMLYLTREAAQRFRKLWGAQLPLFILFGVLVIALGGLGAAIAGGPLVVLEFFNAWVGIRRAVELRNRSTKAGSHE